jgi:hypothetical protein
MAPLGDVDVTNMHAGQRGRAVLRARCGPRRPPGPCEDRSERAVQAV